jgi:hypothetical protein
VPRVSCRWLLDLLAAHGYAALALAYHGTPGLPATLQHIRLEYFLD